MDSIWMQTVIKSFPELRGDVDTDVLIIGGGMTGILCAKFLKEAGIDYILAEADRICSGITKHTTAKITSQHGLIYQKLIKEFGIYKAGIFLRANEQAIGMYKSMCQDIECDFKEENSFVYSLTDQGVLENEVNAVNVLRGKAEYVSDCGLPFSTKGAVKFQGQAQFHPLRFVNGIVEGLNIYEKTKVTQLVGHKAVTRGGTIHAKRIVVATHFPFINKHGMYYLKMYQNRSYVISLKGAQNVHGMWIDEDENGLSFRNYEDVLLLGGAGHRTGKPGGKWEELKSFAKLYYPDALISYQWATQDCMTLDKVPYIGRYGRRTDDMYVATGYNKWGMTSSMVAAQLLADMLMGKDNPYEELFTPQRTILRKQLFVNAFETTVNMLSFKKKRCPHLGCALKWNPDEKTWDCPCHGSRFEKNGGLIDNPATADLKK